MKKKKGKMDKYQHIKKEVGKIDKMTSFEVSKHSKDSAWEKAEDSVRALSDKILGIQNRKEEKE